MVSCFLGKGLESTSDTSDRFDARLKEFGWDKISLSTTANKNNNVRKIEIKLIEYENNKMIDFIEKYHSEGQYFKYELYCFKGEELNKKLRCLLEDMGLYDFDIDPYIINGSETTRVALLGNIDINFLRY
jgi:hypothetical protein